MRLPRGTESFSAGLCSPRREKWGDQFRIQSPSIEHQAVRVSCSVVSDSVTPWTVAYQAPLFMGFSRQEYWSGLPFPPPGDLPNPGIEPTSLSPPALQASSLPLAQPEDMPPGPWKTSSFWLCPQVSEAGESSLVSLFKKNFFF